MREPVRRTTILAARSTLDQTGLYGKGGGERKIESGEKSTIPEVKHGGGITLRRIPPNARDLSILRESNPVGLRIRDSVWKSR